MASFEMIYEEEEDVLEVTFALFDEHFARSIPLNANILLHTDSTVSVAWGITFYNYTQLLQVNETDLDELLPLEQTDRMRLYAVLTTPPASLFLEMLDASTLRALVKAPNLQQLMT